MHAVISLYLKTDQACILCKVLRASSTVEARTAEEAKSLSKTESCDRKPVIHVDLQMPASRNLAVNRNINQFQRLMGGHGAAKMRHTYTLVWRSTATFIRGGYATPDYLQVQYLYEYSSLSVQGTRTIVEAGRVLADQRQTQAQL